MLRNPEEDRRSAMAESLEACGLTQEQMEKAQKYINGETNDCDLGIQEKAVYVGQSFIARNEGIDKCFQRLNKHKEYDIAARYFSVLFQIFGVNLEPLYYRNYSIHKMLPADLRLAIEANHCYFGNGMGRVGSYKNFSVITEDKKEILKALKLTSKKNCNADFALLSVLFYDGMKSGAWNGKAVFEQAGSSIMGVLDALSDFFKGGKKLLEVADAVEKHDEQAKDNYETNQYVKDYPQEFQRYLKMFPEILIATFGGTFSAEEENMVREYLQNGDGGKNLSGRLISVISHATMNETMGKTFLGTGVINYRLSPVIHRFYKLILSSSHMERALDMINQVSCKSDMKQEYLRWHKDFQLSDERFIKWLAGRRLYNGAYGTASVKSDAEGALTEMIRLVPDAYLQAVKTADTNTQDALVTVAKTAQGGSFYRGKIEPLMGQEKESYQQKVIAQIVPDVDPALKKICEDFIRGRGDVALVYQNETALLASRRTYVNLSGSLLSYIKVYGQDGFYERGLAFLGIIGSEYSLFSFCRKGGSYNFSHDLMLSMMEASKRGGLDTLHRLKVAAMILDSYQGKKEDKMKVFAKHFRNDLQEHRDETILAFQNAPVSSRILGIGLLSEDCVTNKAALLAYLSENSKQVREELMKIYGAHEEWLEDILVVLKNSKKSGEREFAAAVLGKYKGIMAYREELQAVIEKEKSKKVIDLIRAALRAGGSSEGDLGGDGAQGEAAGATCTLTPDEYVKECHKGGKKKALAWISQYENLILPQVHLLKKTVAENGETVQENGETASEEYMQAVLLTYSSMPTPGLNQDVRILTDNLNAMELAAYMEALFEIFLSNGAEAKRKWVLYAVAIHGGSRIVPKLKRQIDDWAEHSRGAMAAEAVKALTLNDSPTALLMVDGIARKYKFKQVRKAAQDAMAFAAAQLGLTVEELADRIVPDLGFDEKMERHFDYGPRSFTVKISPDLDIEVKDESGKKIKSLPAIGKNDDEAKAKAALEEFKELKKQMKTTVKNQALRLELALSIDRKWTVENWKKLFVKNPIMHQFAISLIWGHYKDAKLVQTFRYMEDGTFNTMDEDEYELEEKGLIGLVHPLELDQESIATWKEQLSDYEITQAIEQLGRPVYLLEDGEKGQKHLERFGGKILNGLSLAGKLTGLGWSKGMPEDAGIYYSYYRKDVEAGYGVELQFSGAYIGDENDDVTVYDAQFYTLEDFDKRGYGYSHTKNQNDKAQELDKVPARYFSEIVYQLVKATASSTETDEEWRKEAR